ncbi:SDR family NAD(P)-dependent oxidoreductase, partial [Candidatus Microgenomates bacterium]|nr:SDR family NAD(P)-dependent oxidoreductase [Candidatus Microgenomates bacterium]
MDLKDKVVLITGSSNGIGKAAALRFAKEGTKVIVNYREDAASAEKVVHEIGDKAFAIQADVTDSAQVKKMFTEAVQKFGTIDILINNAGLATPKPFLKITKEDLIKEFDLNFFSMVSCSQEAAKIMEKGGGKIINVTSVCALTGCTTVMTFST